LPKSNKKSSLIKILPKQLFRLFVGCILELGSLLIKIVEIGDYLKIKIISEFSKLGYKGRTYSFS